MKVCREEDQSDQVQSSEESSQEQEGGPAGQQDQGGQSRPMEGQTMQVLLKIVHGMQSMQEMMLRSKEEGSDEPEVARVAPQLPHLPEWSVLTPLRSISMTG